MGEDEEPQEPSNFALSISERLVAGESFDLTEEAIASLTRYEQIVLKKTAARNRYRAEYDMASDTVTFIPEFFP